MLKSNCQTPTDFSRLKVSWLFRPSPSNYEISREFYMAETMRFQLICWVLNVVSNDRVVYLNSNRQFGTVPYHLARLKELKKEMGRVGKSRNPRNPSRFRDYFHLDTLLWHLRGKKSLVADWEQEQTALLELGYFERREITITKSVRGRNLARHSSQQRLFWRQQFLVCPCDRAEASLG